MYRLLLPLLLTVVTRVSCRKLPEEENQVAGEYEMDEMRAAIIVNQHKLQSLQAALPVQEPSCPHPYTKFVNECFYLSKKVYTWDQARIHCQGMGGDLAAPAHVYALDSFIIQSKVGEVHVWVGGRKNDNGEWRWLNNRTIQDIDWNTRRLAGPSHDCLYYYSYFFSMYPPLANQDCSELNIFACQYQLQ